MMEAVPFCVIALISWLTMLVLFRHIQGCKANSVRVEMKMWCPVTVKMFLCIRLEEKTKLRNKEIKSLFHILNINLQNPHIVIVFVLILLCLFISVNMHFWTLLEMLSAGLCWPFTVTETRAYTIMASLITAHLFFVTAFKASNAMRNNSETRNAIIISVSGLICLPLPSGPFSPAASVFLWP